MQERERARIARDLHDTLGQRLVLLRLKIESLRECPADEWPRGFDELLTLADVIDQELDFLAWQMRPPALEDLGLVAAMKEFVDDWSAIHRIPASFEATGADGRLPPEVETCLYRVCQEALTNVVKHARATRVAVLIQRSDDDIVLIVEDDGQGAGIPSPSRCVASHPLGLTGMRERVMLVGGTFQMELAAARGTTVFVRVPIGSGPAPSAHAAGNHCDERAPRIGNSFRGDGVDVAPAAVTSVPDGAP